MAEKNGGGDPAEEEEDKNDDGSGEEKKKKHSDPELLMCLLQPCPAGSDPEYIGIRRLLLSRKSQSSIHRRRVSFCILIQRFMVNQSIIHFQCESVCLFVNWRIGDAMERGTWLSVITFGGQGIGNETVCGLRVSKPLQETGSLIHSRWAFATHKVIDQHFCLVGALNC